MYQGPPNFTLKSGVSAVVADGSSQIPGWVSGNLGSLAASASVDIIFDLGPNWDSYRLIQLGHTGVTGSTGVTVVSVKSSSDSTTSSDDIALTNAFNTTMTALSATSSATSRTGFVRPQERFLIVGMSNADATNPVNAGALVKITGYAAG